MEDSNFLEFVSSNRTPKEKMPTAARIITEDRAVHLALTYNKRGYTNSLN